jgi:hypothetical protein
LSVRSLPTWVPWSVAGLSILLGFADLTRGGITIAPILLTLGYCVAVPWALLSGTRATGGDEPPPYRAAMVAALAVFVLYLLTLSPSTAMWDASEYIAAAYTLGLPHPPGNPGS